MDLISANNFLSAAHARCVRIFVALWLALLAFAPEGRANAPVAPTITRQPIGGIAGVGENFQFSLLVAGTEPFSYQWQRDGGNLAGATNARLVLTNLTTSQSGNYTVLVTNIAGRMLSSNATLSVQTEVPRRLELRRVFQLGGQVGAPLILRTTGQENAVSFSLSYDTNAYSNPVFLTVYSNATQTLDLSLPGVAGVALTLPDGETFRPGYRVFGLLRFDLAAGYTPIQGGLMFATNPLPIAVTGIDGAPLPLFVGIQPHHQLITTNTLNLQSGLFEQRVLVGNPSGVTMSNVNIAVYGLGVDSRSNAITIFNAQSTLDSCPLNDCQIYVECECSCDFYDPFWGFCYGYVYCSDDDCNTYETGTTVSTPYVQINNLLPGESRELTLEYYVTDHATLPNPRYSFLVGDPLLHLIPGDTTPLAITGMRYTNQVFLLQFDTALGSTYFIQYAGTPEELATNSIHIKTAFPAVTGTGGSVQWTDNGPPKTDTPPVNGSRFYRILQSE